MFPCRDTHTPLGVQASFAQRAHTHTHTLASRERERFRILMARFNTLLRLRHAAYVCVPVPVIRVFLLCWRGYPKWCNSCERISRGSEERTKMIMSYSHSGIGTSYVCIFRVVGDPPAGRHRNIASTCTLLLLNLMHDTCTQIIHHAFSLSCHVVFEEHFKYEERISMFFDIE